MYIARNSNGCLWLFANKPKRVKTKDGGYWEANGNKMPIELRGVLSWKDEPVPVRLQSDWVNESTKL